jgi:hypothetical protein
VLFYLFGRGETTPQGGGTTTTAGTTTTTVTTTTTSPGTPTTTTTTAPPLIQVPGGLIGKTADEATKILNGAGFGNVKVVLDTGGDATSSDMGKLVISVNPASGTSVVGTTQIVLTVDSKTDDGNG